jgi:hypothetical protein
MREVMRASGSSGAGSGRPDWQRRAIRRFAGALVLIIIGSIIAATQDGDAEAIGWGISGLGMTLATIFLFLEIGLSEDRDRAGR